jgi:hypothetical protein
MMSSEFLTMLTASVFITITVAIGVNYGFFNALIFFLCIFLTLILWGKIEDEN